MNKYNIIITTTLGEIYLTTIHFNFPAMNLNVKFKKDFLGEKDSC